jgi:hypothetical protein
VPIGITVASQLGSSSRTGARVAQSLLSTLELALELLQSSVRAKAPSVQLGSQQGNPIATVVDVSLQLVYVIRPHASNSITEYALHSRISRVPFRLPSCCWRQTMKG